MKKLSAVLLPFMGFLYLSAYIRSATLDVVYTDYIRIAVTYLYHPFSPALYFRRDALTRLPITYFERVVNILLFGYSTTFDMMLGIGFLALMGLLLGIYMVKKNLSLPTMVLVMLLVFSLSQWEMITNGTGWVHFFAFFMFLVHFYVYDSYVGRPTRGKKILNFLLPVVTILSAAGSYSLAYGAALLVVYGIFYKKGKKENLWFAIPVVLSVGLFLCSYACSDKFNAGATTESIFTVLARDPLYFPQFGLNSLASDVMGVGLVEEYGIPHIWLLLTGAVVFVFYILALYVNLRHKLYEKSLLPFILVLSGVFSHGLILLTRWIFLNPLYAMSSRYALQFGAGLIGVCLTFALYQSLHKERKTQSRLLKPWVSLFFLFVLAGNLATAANEIRMAKYRMEDFEKRREIALTFREQDNATLIQRLQYYDHYKIREALTLLRDNEWNIFRPQKSQPGEE